MKNSFKTQLKHISLISFPQKEKKSPNSKIKINHDLRVFYINSVRAGSFVPIRIFCLVNGKKSSDL